MAGIFKDHRVRSGVLEVENVIVCFENQNVLSSDEMEKEWWLKREMGKEKNMDIVVTVMVDPIMVMVILAGNERESGEKEERGRERGEKGRRERDGKRI